MNALIEFMEQRWGRGLRVLLGIALIFTGLLFVGGYAGWLVAILGLAPLAMGTRGPCLLKVASSKARHI